MDQIFNADDTSLNYKMLPYKTLTVKADREAPGAKKCKEYLTVLTCAITYRSFRLSSLLFVKLAKSCALKNYDF